MDIWIVQAAYIDNNEILAVLATEAEADEYMESDGGRLVKSSYEIGWRFTQDPEEQQPAKSDESAHLAAIKSKVTDEMAGLEVPQAFWPPIVIHPATDKENN